MQDILMRAGCFIGIIILGYTLRSIGVFKDEDFKVLSTIVVKITLPAAIVSSFNGKEIDPTMLSIAVIGFGGGVIYMILAWLINKRTGKEKQAFAMLNSCGYNIGNFTLPFVQSFLGPVGVITTSLFDTGNACICLGGAYSVASMVKDGGRFSVKRILNKLIRSVPFLCYVVMITTNLCHIPMPAIVFEFADIIAGANAFMAMLMIGVGFKLSGDRSQIGAILKILVVRYSVAAVIGLSCFFLLPFALEVRQALLILAFSPIASAAPAFTAEMDGDVGLSSAVNSISIVVSIVIIVGILMVTV